MSVEDLNTETGASTGVETPVVHTPLNEAPVDGPGSGRSTLRKQLEKNAEAVRKPAETREQKSAPKQKSRARQELESEDHVEPEVEAPIEAEEQEHPEEQQTKAPEGWAKEAKAAWGQLPPAVQAAVAKREADMAKGVEDLKKKQGEIDQVLAPRMEVIRRHGHTPAQAINQLFAWFEALSANPHMAFPALANSFKFDLRSIPGIIPQGQQQQPAAQPGAQAQPNGAAAPQGEIPPYVKSLEQQIQELKQGFSQQYNQLSSTFAQQTQQKTEEILANWSKDKPYFEDVRKTMAHLIASQAVAPLPNGSADLDRAYDMAIYALPEVRTKVLAEQQKREAETRKAKAEAEKAAQQAQADKARKANGGTLIQGAPGNPLTPQSKSKKGKSVRESIMDARNELADQ
jgi:hypothetical protein